MKKYLITGGTGYIGSHMTAELLNKGHDVVIIDNLSNSKKDVLEGIEKITGKMPDFFETDLLDKENLNNIFDKHPDIQCVMHFAGRKAVGESVEKPSLYYENNLLSTINLLNEMIAREIENIIYSSTAAVYGQPEKVPVDENTSIQKPNSPYGNTKKIIEEVIEDVSRVNNIKCVSLRYFNVAGAHESSHIGEFPSGEPANLLPYITQTAAGVIDELKIFGNDFNTRDGFGVRDYIHVMDLVSAHIAAAERLLKNENKNDFEIFNLGTGRGYSVKEIVDEFEKVTNQKLKYKIVDRRKGDIDEIYTDTELANKELNWKAERSLKDMIETAWRWEKKIRNIE